MRQYRGKRVDGGGRVYGYKLVATDGTVWIVPQKGAINTSNLGFIVNYSYEVIPESVGQSTGLKDKDDVMIYEGDIVKGKDGFGKMQTVEVKFRDGAFYPLHEGEFYWTDIKVIGNTTDTPELLKKANQ